MKKKNKYIILITLILFFLTLNVKAEESKLKYTTHVQTYGWQEWKEEGYISGTSGKAKRIESIRIMLQEGIEGNIEYSSFVESYGWLNWVSDGEASGTEGEAKRLEAIKIRITGQVAETHDIYYRVHTQTYGWLGWAKNGEIAGTIGEKKRLEAIEIKMLSKDEVEEQNTSSFIFMGDSIECTTHIQKLGWQEPVTNSIFGTEGKALRVEAIKMQVFSDLPGEIEYLSLIEGKGWEPSWKKNNEISGTTGEARKIEAVKLRLTKELNEKYDLYYRVHVQGYGWLGWAKNEEIAGTLNYGLRIEALETKLVLKGTEEETFDSFKEKDAYVKYSSTVEKDGKQAEVTEGETSGTVGERKSMYSFQMRLDTNIEGSIRYQTYLRKADWEEVWRQDNEESNPENEKSPIQLLKIELQGPIQEKYDIYYRVHVDKFGWLDWAKNGEIAGVKHYNIQALEVKLYLKIDSNKYQLSTKNHYVDQIFYIPKYYNQKDPRWKDRIYGPKTMGGTGCAPTSMAMAFTGILGQEILPIEIADYLYNETAEYNHYSIGSSGYAIIYASNYYDVKCTPLNSIEEMKNALENGKIVFAAMGNGKFATKNWNHAIVLYSYYLGTTYAYDPLKSSNNGWVSLTQLWREQSKDPDDSKGGSNFYSLERY